MSLFPHDSFLGGLNLFVREDRSVILNNGERPPFPILISSPTLGQAIKNLNKADLGLALAFFVLGNKEYNLVKSLFFWEKMLILK